MLVGHEGVAQRGAANEWKGRVIISLLSVDTFIIY